MDGYTAEQVRAAEAPLLAAGVPLMARAAAGLAAEGQRLLPRPGHIVLLVGSGNNGGDALFAGAEWAAAGHRVTIVPVSERVHGEGLRAARAAGAVVEATDAAARLAAECDLLVDGLVGTGTSTNSALRGRAREVVAAVLPVLREPQHPLVVAVDIPSGVNPDDGAVPDPLVLPADVTVTFGAMKAGLLLSPARELAGRVVVIDIGLGEQLAAMKPALRVE